MAAGKDNILIEKKADFAKEYTMYTMYVENPDGTPSADSIPLDLTGCTLVSKLKTKIGGSSLGDFVAVVTDGPNGVFEISLSKTTTSSLPNLLAPAVFDILLTFPGGDTIKVIEGNAIIDQTVS